MPVGLLSLESVFLGQFCPGAACPGRRVIFARCQPSRRECGRNHNLLTTLPYCGAHRAFCRDFGRDGTCFCPNLNVGRGARFLAATNPNGGLTVMETKSALRIFLKNEAGAVICDLTVFLGDSIELAMIVTGVSSTCALVAANDNSTPRFTGSSVRIPKVRMPAEANATPIGPSPLGAARLTSGGEHTSSSGFAPASN